jgi:glycopeptide antibiotics resistance protein
VSALEKKPSRSGGRVLLVVLFVVYLGLLAWIVLWKLEVPHVGGGALRQIKLVPFASSAGAGASAPFEVVANIVFFVPFGLYLGLLAPSWPWWKAAGAVAGASLVLEVAQYVLAVGSSDVTDLVGNTAGGLAGIGLLALARRRLQARTATVMTWVCSIGTVLALLASGIFVASPLRYAPPRHVAVVSTPVPV